MRCASRALLALAALAAAACSGAISSDELPSDPIAFVRQSASEGLLSRDQFLAALRIEDQDRPSTTKPKLKTTLSLLAPESAEVTVVPEAQLGAIPFDWSPDGSHLLVGRVDPTSGAIVLFTWNRMTGAWTRVLRSVIGRGASLADGPMRFAWHGAQREGRGVVGTIWTAQSDGTESVLPGGRGGVDPDLSPDGLTVIFSRPEMVGGPETIYALTPPETEPRALARGAHARFSRDGRWIAFARVSGGQSDIWIMRADGTAKRRVTATGYDEDNPAPSPDGRYVVYSSSRGGENETLLYVARVADGAERELVHNGQNGRPVW